MAASSAESPRRSAEFMTDPQDVTSADSVTSAAPADGGRAAGPDADASYLVRYFAAAWAATGVEEETLTVPTPTTVADVLAAAVARHGAELERVLERCSFLRNSVAVHDRATVLDPGDALDVLPPFAGG